MIDVMVPLLMALFAAFRTGLPAQNVLAALSLASGAGFAFQWAGSGRTPGDSWFQPAWMHGQTLDTLFLPAVWVAQFFGGDALSRWILGQIGPWKPSRPGFWRLVLISCLSLVLNGVLQYYATSRAPLEMEAVTRAIPFWSAGSAVAWLVATLVTHVVLVPWMIDKTGAARTPDLPAAATWIFLASYFALRA